MIDQGALPTKGQSDLDQSKSSLDQNITICVRIEIQESIDHCSISSGPHVT